MNKPNPRDLDPKFRKDETERDPNESYIVHRVQFVDSDGNVGVKEHGPMPVSEWAAYSEKNGL